MKQKSMTRYEQRMARDIGIVRTVGLLLLAVVVAVVCMGVLGTEAEAPEVDDYARYQAQEEYYRVLDLYGDTEGATEAARIVFEREVADYAED